MKARCYRCLRLADDWNLTRTHDGLWVCRDLDYEGCIARAREAERRD